MSSRQLKMYFRASLDLMPISPSCSAGVCRRTKHIEEKKKKKKFAILDLFSVDGEKTIEINKNKTTHLQPPKWIAGVRTSVEKTAGLCAGTQKILRW